MIGYTRDLLYNLGVAENIWSLSLKHDIQTWFVALTGAYVACFYYYYGDLVILNGIKWRFMSDHCFTRS